MSSWSPPCGNYGLSSSPLHLEYYQVAAGYSYGIPAIMTVPPTSSQVLNTHLPLPSNPSYVNPGHMIPHGLQVPSHMTSNINQVMPSSLQWPLTSYSDRGYDLSTVGKTWLRHNETVSQNNQIPWFFLFIFVYSVTSPDGILFTRVTNFCCFCTIRSC